jgi:orotidine-5'-phosphate decarboxylase
VALALDILGPYERRVSRAVELIDGLIDKVACVKINQHLILPFGLYGLREVLERCNRKDVPVIADLKLNDIESTNLEAIDTLYGMGVDAVIANPFVGFREGLGRVLEKSRDMGKGVILLVYMSHQGAREGYDMKVNGKSLWRIFAERVRRWNADGAIVSAKSPSRIREVRRRLLEDQLILSPGVGHQGGDAKKALDAGADIIIVGRTVVDSPEPARKLEEIRLLAQAR